MESIWLKMSNSLGTEEYIPRLINIIPSKNNQFKKYLLFLLCFILFLLILGIIFISIYLSIYFNQHHILIITNNSTTTTISITTSIICLYPNILNESNICINIMIDSNNCGYLHNRCLLNTSCSAGICSNVPGIELTNPISIFSSPINGFADDQIYNVILPWNLTLYNRTKNQISLTTNGIICFGNCSTIYIETSLPSNIFSDVTLFPYWDDLYIYANTSQGIYYESEGNFPNRIMIFEYYMSHYLQPQQYYHFQILFFENSSSIIQYKYFDATDGGQTTTIGLQASSIGPYIMYSFDQLNSVRSNLVITFNTILGTYYTSMMK